MENWERLQLKRNAKRYLQWVQDVFQQFLDPQIKLDEVKIEQVKVVLHDLVMIGEMIDTLSD